MKFPIKNLGKIASVDLDIETATCYIQWIDGTKAIFFISGTDPAGYFKFENLPAETNKAFLPCLEPPSYQVSKYDNTGKAIVGGQDLARLGYTKGSIRRSDNFIDYHQQGWENFSYDIALGWKNANKQTLVGACSITSLGSPYSSLKTASGIVSIALKNTFDEAWRNHKKWWADYWLQSSIQLPDSILMHQYDMDMYLFGAASRKGAPPISLQAVWTADNGKLPPWHGDFHNDLNTQLSYWPGYTSNHLQESSVFTDWLWEIKPAAERYTQHIFKDTGLNVPGVAILTGTPRGLWAQYTFSPTVSCWLSQYFYWQWIYSGDKSYLRNRFYPWIKATVEHIESIASKSKDSQWELPISSSPEFFDGSLKAWFLQTSNFDLSLIRWQLQTAIQLSDTLQLTADAAHWKQFLSGWPELAINNKDSSLLVAPGIAYSFSHRHFSHLMSIYPLQLADWFHSEKDQKMIQASLNELKHYGPSGWNGNSYAWEACLKAMAQDGTGAAKALKIFATAFCSPNSFHLNGDQSGKGYSGFTYRPFTLEANFAFAQGVQLMLLQQHEGINYIFPAIPDTWLNASFQKLRAPGAFLISAKKENGEINDLQIASIIGGQIKIKNPFVHQKVQVKGAKLPPDALDQDVLVISLSPGQDINKSNDQTSDLR